jgi:hypothetical protein
MEGERREAAATDIEEDSGGAARRGKGGGSPAQKRMEASALSLSLSLAVTSTATACGEGEGKRARRWHRQARRTGDDSPTRGNGVRRAPPDKERWLRIAGLSEHALYHACAAPPRPANQGAVSGDSG